MSFKFTIFTWKCFLFSLYEQMPDVFIMNNKLPFFVLHQGSSVESHFWSAAELCSSSRIGGDNVNLD